MKANEIQIGDWVHLKDVDMNLKVASISSLEFQRWNTNDEYNIVTLNSSNPDFGNYIESKEEETEPILLTQEMLEKNGWWYTDYWYHHDVRFCLEEWKGRYQCYDCPHMEFEFVHQLQQALRLCGRKELADNFKI